MALGGDAARAAHDAFAADLTALLDLPPGQVADPVAWTAAIGHAHAYYAWSWDARAVALVPALTQAIEGRAAQPVPDLPALLELLDLLYFIGWCFEASNLAQCRLVLPGMQAAARAFQRLAQPARRPRPGPPRICFLSMFAGKRDVMTLAPRMLMDAFRALPGGCELSMVAWRFAEPDFVAELRAAGVTVTVTAGETTPARLSAAQAAVAAIAPDILITDMNNAVPIAIFAQRAAPAQVFLQGGMPAFPRAGLDAVFDSFGIGAARAGWGSARLLPFDTPWDLDMLLPPQDPAQMAAEAADMPPGRPLFGVYGRLVKLTPDYLRVVERILLAVPAAHFVAGGTGDDTAIRDFARTSPAGARIHIRNRFVPGHAWGRLLDLFLDTWPLTGGESVRETMAKGCPVVSRHSAEMPALDRQRDPALVAQDEAGFADLAIALLRDDAARAQAGARAITFARRMADPAPFARQSAEALRLLLRDAGSRVSLTGRLLRRLGLGPA